MANDTRAKVDEVVPDLEVASSDNVPANVKKVELDLDDAPFLQRDEPPPPAVPDEPPPPKEDDAGKRRKKKLALFGAIVAVVLVLILVAVWFFFFRTPPPAPPEPPKPDVVVVPSAPVADVPKDIVRQFAPFIVPVAEANGKTRFLTCKFAVISHDQKVNEEMAQRLVPLRDAVYFYLRGKDSGFLLDARNGDSIKKDLASIFNDYLSQGKVEDIVFESYLSR